MFDTYAEWTTTGFQRYSDARSMDREFAREEVNGHCTNKCEAMDMIQDAISRTLDSEKWTHYYRHYSHYRL